MCKLAVEHGVAADLGHTGQMFQFGRERPISFLAAGSASDMNP
jgi:hypothetical protein